MKFIYPFKLKGYMISSDFIKDLFRIENAFPTAIIDDRISLVETMLQTYLGQPYTDMMSNESEEAKMTKKAHAYLTMANLLSRERIVLTGFGAVVKTDEYSRPVSEEADEIARQYTATAGTLLRTAGFARSAVAKVLEGSQSVTEMFFNNK